MNRQSKGKEVDKRRPMRSFVTEKKSPFSTGSGSNPWLNWDLITPFNPLSSSAASQTQTDTRNDQLPIDISLRELFASGDQLDKRCSSPLESPSKSTPTLVKISEKTEEPPKSIEPPSTEDKQIQTDRSTATIGTSCNPSLALNLPKFCGEPLDWPIFKQTFDYTTISSNYSPIENILRLFDALQGDALEAVKVSFACWNAETVLELLEMRFGNATLLLESLVAVIKRLPNLIEEPHRLAEFATDLRSVTASLKAHKLGGGQLNNHDLLAVILRKLPESMLFDCIRFKSDDESLSKMEKLSDFVFLQAKLHLECGVALTCKPGTSSARKRSCLEEEQPQIQEATNFTKRRNVV